MNDITAARARYAAHLEASKIDETYAKSPYYLFVQGDDCLSARYHDDAHTIARDAVAAPMMQPDLAKICVPGNIWSLFHRAWGQAQAGSEYDKDVFRQLEAKLLALQKAAQPVAVVQPSLEACVAELAESAKGAWTDTGKLSVSTAAEIVAKRWPTVQPPKCECELRNRRWNPNTGKCETCSLSFGDCKPVAAVQPSEFTGSIEGCKVVSVGDDGSILVDTPGGSRRRYWLAGEAVRPSCIPCPESPPDLTFEAVNDFVHHPEQQFEYLQWLCLTLATALEKATTVQPSEATVVENGAKFLRGEVSKVVEENERLRAELAALRSENERLAVDNMATDTENERLRDLHAAMVERFKRLDDVCMDWLAVWAFADLPEEMQELRLRMSTILAEPQVAETKGATS